MSIQMVHWCVVVIWTIVHVLMVYNMYSSWIPSCAPHYSLSHSQCHPQKSIFWKKQEGERGQSPLHGQQVFILICPSIMVLKAAYVNDLLLSSKQACEMVWVERVNIWPKIVQPVSWNSIPSLLILSPMHYPLTHTISSSRDSWSVCLHLSKPVLDSILWSGDHW